MIRYYKLFDLLNRMDLKKSDLLDILSSKTIAKLSKGDTITTETIDKICERFNCQPGDIMEYTVNAISKIDNKQYEIAIHDGLDDYKEAFEVYDAPINVYKKDYTPDIPE